MKTALKIILCIVVALILVCVIALVVADSKFAAIRPAPEVPLETLVKADTRILAVLDGPLAKDFVKQRFLSDAPVPDWVLPKALPYKAVLAVNTSSILGIMDVGVFVNDQRLGPVILEKAKQFKVPPPFDAWFEGPMARRQPGLLAMEGSTGMDALLLKKIEDQWKVEGPLEPLRAEGGHLLEAILDNRDGGATAVIATVAGAQGLDMAELMNEGRLATIAAIASIRLQVDLIGMEKLKLHLVIECAPDDPDMVGVIGFFIQMVPPQLNNMFMIPVEGTAEVKGNLIEGNYTVPVASLMALTAFL